MICPGCGTSDMVPLGRAVEAPRMAYRERKCSGCGKRWATIERCLKATVKISLNHGLIIKPSDGLNHGGTLRGGLDPVLSEIPSDPGLMIAVPEVMETVEASGADAGARDRPKRGRGDAVDYPEAFENLWRDTGRHGNKHPAFKAWDLIKTVATLTVLVDRWRDWEKTDKWRAGYVPNLSTWLNARGWQDLPPEHEFRNRGAAAPMRGAARNVDHMGEWLEKRGGEG